MTARMELLTEALGCLLCWAALASCSIIDDTPGECGYKENYELDYELRLVTNMTTELKTQLSTQTELSLAHSLRTHLSDVFTDFAHDVDLSFYDTVGDSLRLQHDEHIMDANQASYALNLPKRQYMHLAVANIVDDKIVDLVNDERCHRSELILLQGGALRGIDDDAIDSHTTGIFTARQPMDILEGVDQQFNVHLYMANCAAVLVIDTIGSGVKDIKVYSKGFATGFHIADSSYVFVSDPPLVRTKVVTSKDDEDSELAFCSVTFPSREPSETRTVIETTDPFVSPESNESLWEFHIYATANDGSTTLTKLYIRRPLRAGQLMIIKAKAYPDGSINTDNQTVGVSVTLNWNDGGHYDPEL